jgi:hypothetical protein
MIRFLLNHSWFVARPGIFMVQATPALCLSTLKTAAKPSTKRLHLRNLFESGRRYQITSRDDGFRITTTSKVRWHYRKRTGSSAVLTGTFTALNDNITRIDLSARIHVGYLLDIFLLPFLIGCIVVYAPWHPLVIGLALTGLFGLSWTGHRYNAILEAHAMMWFVQKALEALVPAEVRELRAGTDSVIYDFQQAWNTFYDEQTTE